MPDVAALVPDGIAGWFGAGMGGAGGFVMFKWLLEFVAGRSDKREAALDAGTQRLIGSLEQRLDAVTRRLDQVEKELAECTTKHAEAEARALRLEATLQGMGDARQTAALIVAAEKAKGN